MRRRHVQTVREEERPTLLLMAAGAVAGAAAGLYLGRRYRSMDAFLADVRDRFEALKDIWYDEDLALESRQRRRADIADIDDEEEEDEDDLEEFDEDEFEAGPYAPESLDDDDDDDDIDDDDDGDDALDDEDEFEEELAAVGRENGVTDASLRAEEKARQLESKVLRVLRDEPTLSMRSIELAVVGDGVIELTGRVNAIEEVSLAAALVRGVPGVSMVLNRLEVSSGGKMDTASVARDPLDAPQEDRA
jgi:hypothetical protein